MHVPNVMPSLAKLHATNNIIILYPDLLLGLSRHMQHVLYICRIRPQQANEHAVIIMTTHDSFEFVSQAM